MVIGSDKFIRVRRTDRWNASNKCYDFILRWSIRRGFEEENDFNLVGFQSKANTKWIYHF